MKMISVTMVMRRVKVTNVMWLTAQMSRARGTGGKGQCSRPVHCNTLQGNGQSAMHVSTQHITGTFRIFPASVPAISLVWGVPSTFTVPWIT